MEEKGREEINEKKAFDQNPPLILDFIFFRDVEQIFFQLFEIMISQAHR